jgi:hypothetical protein
MVALERGLSLVLLDEAGPNPLTSGPAHVSIRKGGAYRNCGTLLVLSLPMSLIHRMTRSNRALHSICCSGVSGGRTIPRASSSRLAQTPPEELRHELYLQLGLGALDWRKRRRRSRFPTHAFECLSRGGAVAVEQGVDERLLGTYLLRRRRWGWRRWKGLKAPAGQRGERQRAGDGSCPQASRGAGQCSPTGLGPPTDRA